MLTPEACLVFRTAAEDVRPDEWRSLIAGVRDWERVFHLADRQVALLALWRALRSVPGLLETTPPEFAEALRRVALVEDLRMQQLARRAQQTVAALAAAEVPALLLKGSAVGAMRDPTFRSRPMTDVDVLVRRADVPRASAAILAAGWKLTDDAVLLDLLKDAHHLPHFVDQSLPGMRLELHVMVMPDDQPFGITADAFWADAVSAPPPFARAFLPSPPHLMLHTAVHFAWQHMAMFGAWRTFRVIALIGSASDFDWQVTVALAHRHKALSVLYWTLRLARSMSNVAVPEDIVAQLRPPGPPALQNAIERHFLALNAPGEGPTSPSVQLTRWLWTAALRPGWSGYPDLGRRDPDRRWANAYGRGSTESRAARYLRHVRHAGAWVQFVRRTLLS